MKQEVMPQNLKYIIILLILQISIWSESHAQSFDRVQVITGERSMQINDLEIDSEGNVYICGGIFKKFDFQDGVDTVFFEPRYPLGTNDSIDAFVSSYSKNGRLNWNNLFFGGSYTRDAINYIELNNREDIYLALKSDGNLDMDLGPDTVIATGAFGLGKYNQAGKYLWSHSYCDSGEMPEFSIDDQGNKIVFGWTQIRITPCGDFDPGPALVEIPQDWLEARNIYYIARYDHRDSLSWLQYFKVQEIPNNFSLTASPKGNFSILADFSGTIDLDFSPGTYQLVGRPGRFQASVYTDFLLATYDSIANIKWAKKILVHSKSLRQSRARRNARFFFTGPPCHSYQPLMAYNKQEELYLALNFADTIDLNPNQAGGEYYSRGDIDFLLCKLDTAGNFLWSKQFGGPGDDHVQDLQVDHQGQLILTGNFSDTVDFDAGTGVHNLYSTADLDIFLGKYDSLGNLLWVHALSGPGNQISAAVRIDQESSLFLAGVFEDSVDFDIDSTTITMRKSAGEYDGFIAKYRQCLEPEIRNELEDTVLCAQDSLLLQLSAAGAGLSYQWYVNGTVISGATDSLLSLANLTSTDSGYYHCEVSMACPLSVGPIVRRSDTMRLDIRALTQVTLQPVDAIGCQGDSLSLDINAQGVGLSYQWYRNGMPIVGADSTQIQFLGVSPQDTGIYYCELLGACGPRLSSRLATVSILPPPSLDQQPRDTLGCPNENASFNLSASGPGLNYQWYVNGQAIGTSQPMLTISSATLADSGWYYCIVSGSCDPSVRSDSVRLDLREVPAVQSSPMGLLRMRGDTARFSVSATGDSLSYQWYKDNNPLANNARITGSQSTMLEIRNLVFTDSGSYHCEVSGVCLPPANSDPAQLQIGGVSIDDEIVSLLKVYPNPSRGVFQVEGPANRRISLRVFDARGVEIVSTYVTRSLKLDLSAYADGTYILIAEDGSSLNLIVRR